MQNINPDNFYLWGRALSALLGSITIFVTYLTGRLLYGPAVGLMLGLVLGSPAASLRTFPLRHSRYYGDFSGLATLLFAVLIYKTGQPRWYLWAGVTSGLTISTKYNVGIVFLTVILAHFLSKSTERSKFSLLIKSGVLAIVVFLITTPFALLDLSGFLDEMAFQVRHYTILGHGTASEGASWSAYLYDFWNEAFVYQAAFVALGGIGVALWRQRREDWLVLSLPAIGYLFFSSAKVHFSRNLLPLLPPMAILAALFLILLSAWLANLIKRVFQNYNKDNKNVVKKLAVQTSIVVILWLAFFSFALQHSFLTDRYYLQPDTRKQAAAWIIKQIPTGRELRLESRYTHCFHQTAIKM